ncbi:hypothetical protein Bca4012_065773 [Brassica carinata]
MGDSMANKTQSAGQKRKQPTEPSTDAANASMAKPRKQYVSRSDAWKHFTKSKDDPEKVRCNHCPSVLKYKSKSGTSVLWTHHNACKGYKPAPASASGTQTTLVKSSESGQLVSTSIEMKEKVMRLLRKLFDAYKISQSRNMDASNESQTGQAASSVTDTKVGGSLSSSLGDQ